MHDRGLADEQRAAVEAGVHTRVAASPASILGSRLRYLRGLRGHGRNLGLLLAVLVCIAIVSAQRPTYLSFENLRVVSLQVAFTAIAAVGTMFLIIGGNIDLSIGSNYALTAVLSAMFAKDLPIPLAFVLAIAIGAGIGLTNGLMVWRIKLSPLIVTLGTMTILRGASLVITHGYGVTGVPDAFQTFANTKVLHIPMPVFIFLIIGAIAFVVLHFTQTGQHLYAVGGNRDAASAAALRVRRIILATFAANGLLVALAGILTASRYGSADPTLGLGYELDVITAVLLGGVAFQGGEGGIGGVVLAVALLGVINSGFISLGIDPYYSDIVKGTVLVIAITLDQMSEEQRERFQKFMAMRERRPDAGEKARGDAATSAGG